MSDTSSVDLVSLITRRWRIVALCAVLGAATGVTYALLAPPWYSATLTVVPSQGAQESAAMSLHSRLSSGLGMSSGSDVQRIEAVLKSTSVRDEVIKKFDLGKLYGTAHIEQARAVLGAHCVTGADRRSGLVSLTCEDKDPKRAKELAEYFGEVGNDVLGRVSVSSAREERRFLEAQVLNARNDVDDASRKLRAFQEKNKVVDLPEQSKAVISAMATIKGELISKQLELSYLTSFSARTEAGVVQLQKQIAIMESKLTQLEQTQHLAAGGATAAGSGSGSGVRGKPEFFPNVMIVPELRFELEQLMREQKIKETVFSLMTQRFEMAKVDEARDTSTFQILDYPTLPTYKSRPQRMRIAAMGLAAGLALAFAVVVIPAWWRQRARLKALT